MSLIDPFRQKFLRGINPVVTLGAAGLMVIVIEVPETILVWLTDTREAVFPVWEVNGWAIFCVTGLLLLAFNFRRDLLLTLRSARYSLIGDPEPPRFQRVLWGLGGGALTAVLLVAGGVQAPQDAVITAGFPFSLVMVVMVIGILRALKNEKFASVPGQKRRLAKELWTGRDEEVS